MPNWNDVSGNLANDYVQGASNFIWAAEQICSHVDENSADWLFKLENPVTFLIGHAAELILKAGLAKAGVLKGNLEKTHDLSFLLDKSREQQIPLDDNFCSGVNTINDNFKNHDHRYQRSFAGFPDSEHERLTNLIGDKSSEKEIRKYGLVVKNGLNLKQFIAASQAQLENSVKWLSESA